MSDQHGSVGFPVAPNQCRACSEFLTDCGLPQPDMIAAFPCDTGIPMCGTPTPMVTVDEYKCSAGNCYKAGCEDTLIGIIVAVGEKITDFYGERIDPCWGVRCFPISRCEAVIDSAIRVERVEVSGCRCNPCADNWREIQPCDVRLIAGGDGATPPYKGLRFCNCCACDLSTVRVTGVWGMFWPIPPSIKAVIAAVTTKVFKAITEGNKVISNLNDGVTTFVGASFSTDEFNLLPRSALRYKGRRV